MAKTGSFHVCCSVCVCACVSVSVVCAPNAGVATPSEQAFWHTVTSGTGTNATIKVLAVSPDNRFVYAITTHGTVVVYNTQASAPTVPPLDQLDACKRCTDPVEVPATYGLAGWCTVGAGDCVPTSSS